MNKTWPFKAADVADFLQHNPQFFEEYADVLANIFVPHPHHGQAIPLAERQMLTLREKNHHLEKNLGQFIHYGTENDQLSNKIHHFTRALLAARNREAVFHTIQHQLASVFNVSHFALRFWWSAHISPQTTRVEQTIQDYFSTSDNAYCTTDIPPEVRRWFAGYDDILQSFAVIPLGIPRTFGVLLLASIDSQRFSATHDTYYLSRLSELITDAFLSKSK